jgi:crossover junction endodeoxyribonuclease RuvC
MIIGIDPGLSGAVAALHYDGGLAWVQDLPVVNNNIDPVTFHMLLRQHDISLAVVEQVHSMPKQGVAGVFKFGKGYGAVLGVIAAHEIPLAEPTPSQWKQGMGLGKDKELSRALAIKTWPSMAEYFKLKKHDGRAEAALMALWYLRKTSWPAEKQRDADSIKPSQQRTKKRVVCRHTRTRPDILGTHDGARRCIDCGVAVVT